MEVTIRRARPTDVPRIVELLADDELAQAREGNIDNEDAYRRAFEAINADPRQQLVVAELEGEIVGTLQLSFIPYMTYRGQERAQVEAVRVASPSRDSGIGRRMLEWATLRARERGCHVLQLTMDKRRAGARRFYESFGFQPTHEGFKLHL
jgi:GNAT superfamily N-acetyltransferase